MAARYRDWLLQFGALTGPQARPAVRAPGEASMRRSLANATQQLFEREFVRVRAGAVDLALPRALELVETYVAQRDKRRLVLRWAGQVSNQRPWD